MSRIHEALRRGFKTAQPDRPPVVSAHADAVLATLGYRAESPRTHTRQLLLVLGVVAIFAALYWTWIFWDPFASPHPTPSTAVAQHAPVQRAAQPPSQPARVATPPSQTAPSPAPVTNPSPPPSAPRTASMPAAAVPAAPAPPKPASAAPDNFQLALYYQRAGEFDQALIHYRAVLQRDELNVEAHNNLGLLYKDKGLTDDAVREFRRALFIAPRYLRGHNNLGVTLLELGRVDAAAAEFHAALTIDPRNVDAMVNLALAQKTAGQLDDARGNLVHALTIEPHSAAAHYNLAVQYEDAGEPTRAVEHYRSFLQYAGPEYSSRAPDVRARIAQLEAQGR